MPGWNEIDAVGLLPAGAPGDWEGIEESTPSVVDAVISTDRQVYAPDEAIVVEFSGLPGTQQDWITVVPASLPEDQYHQWFYTGDQQNGSFTFEPLPAGDYEVRLYLDWPRGGLAVKGRHAFKVGEEPASADIQVPADYATIQEAIDAAEAGQIISVAPGLYEENIRLKEGVALTGAGAETTIIDGGGSDVVWGADDALISGFTLRNGGDSGVFAWNTSPTIQNCVITGSEQGIATAVDPLIRGNTITGNSGWGIFVGSSSSSEVAALPTITNNLIAGNLDATGIVLFEAGGIVVNNTIDGNGSYGIDLSASDLPVRVDLRNNIVTSNSWYGISAYPFDGELQTIGYNDVWNNGWGEYDEVEPGEGSIAADPLFVQPLTLPAAKRAVASSRDIGARSRANDDKVQSGPEPRAPRAAAKLAQSDAPAFDYHLQPASPCVDAGDLAASFQDLDGSRNDMGAYGGPLPLGASAEEQPEPDPTRPAPVGPGELVVTPAAPSPADEIVITVSGDFPQSNAAVESQSHSIEGSVVTINIATGWMGDVGATVITPWSIDEEIGPLSAGEYQLVVEVNGDAFLSSSLLVTEAALQESPISIDFDLAAGDQEQQIAGSAAPGKSYELQLHITAAPEISGWSATIEYDPAQVRYASGSFQASSFIPGLLALADDKEGSVGVGGTVLGSGGQNSGDGLLGTLSFEVLEGFTGSTDLVITSLSFRRTDGEEDKRTVRFAATITSEVLVEGLTGDFDGNSKVDFNDFFLFADQFGKSVDVGSLYDLDPNGQVDFNDFFVFADHFGESRAKLIALARKLLGLPSSAVLLPNYPNPFNSTTLIPFQLMAQERVQLRIYNLLGQQVRTLVDQVEQPGIHRVSWDGRDDQGWRLTSGTYIYRLQTGDYADQRTMLLLR